MKRLRRSLCPLVFFVLDHGAHRALKILEATRGDHNGVAAAIHLLSDAQKTSARIFVQVEKKLFAFHLDGFGMQGVFHWYRSFVLMTGCHGRPAPAGRSRLSQLQPCRPPFFSSKHGPTDKSLAFQDMKKSAASCQAVARLDSVTGLRPGCTASTSPETAATGGGVASSL